MITLMGPTSFTFSKIGYFLSTIIKTNKKSYVNTSWSLNLELWVMEFFMVASWFSTRHKYISIILLCFPKVIFNIFLNPESQFYYLYSLLIFPEQGNLDVKFMIYAPWGKDFCQFCLLLYNQSLGHWHVLGVQ